MFWRWLEGSSIGFAWKNKILSYFHESGQSTKSQPLRPNLVFECGAEQLVGEILGEVSKGWIFLVKCNRLDDKAGNLGRTHSYPVHSKSGRKSVLVWPFFSAKSQPFASAFAKRSSFKSPIGPFDSLDGLWSALCIVHEALKQSWELQKNLIPVS